MRNLLTSVAFTLLALATAVPAQAQQVIEIFGNMNTASVQTGAASRATFSLYAPTHVTEVSTYHWNDARGAQPGTITLRHYGGSTFGTYGPFPARGVAGQYNVQNATWVASVGLNLPAGIYEVVDSSPATWSHNTTSGGVGFTKIMGYTAGPQNIPPSPTFTPCSPWPGAPAVFGPCVAKKDVYVSIAMTTYSVIPGFVHFVSGMGNPSGLMIKAPIFRQSLSTYVVRVPAALCQPGAGPNFNVILYDHGGNLRGQIGTLNPDCR